MLNQIKIASLKVYSFHGCNKEERDKGGFFTVDVEIDFDFTASAEKDDLSLTLDYAKVAEFTVADYQEHIRLKKSPENIRKTSQQTSKTVFKNL